MNPNPQKDRPVSDKRERRGVGETPGATQILYRTLGLTFSSSLPIPELARQADLLKHCEDIRIRMGEVEPRPTGWQSFAPWFKVGPLKQCQIDIPNVARFLVEAGSQITIDRRLCSRTGKPAPDADIRTFLLGTALGTLLYQRRLFVLHASAIQTPSGLWAFAGDSGAGKSTLAAWCAREFGYPIFTDDIGVLDPDATEPVLYAGPPRLKLWKDALASLDVSESNLQRDTQRNEKFHIELPASKIEAGKLLRGIIYLSRAAPGETSPRLVRRKGVAAYQTIMASRYRPAISQVLLSQAQLHHAGANLAKQLKIMEYRRSWDLRKIRPHLNALKTLFEGPRNAEANE